MTPNKLFIVTIAIGTVAVIGLSQVHHHSSNSAEPGAAVVQEAGEVPESSEIDSGELMRRRPNRVLLSPDGKFLLVANKHGGTVSVIDTETNSISSEWLVGKSMGDFIELGDGHFLASDPVANEVICVEVNSAGKISVVWRLDSIGSPSALLLNPDGNGFFAGGLWSRQLAQYSMTSEISESPELVSQVNLPFAVGNLTMIENGETILATDAFGGEWATLKPGTLALVRDGELTSRRVAAITGLPGSDKVVVASQPLNRLAQAIRSDVHWGLVISNKLVVMDQESFVRSDWKPERRSPIPFGGPGEGKGDPESIIFANEREFAVAVGGVNQVAIGDITDRSFAYLPTGARPVDCCFSKSGDRLYVANQLDDSVSVIDVSELEVLETISLGKQPKATAVDEGERLFFDATISHDGWMSCHSCHVEGHTSGFLNDNFSDQSFGAPKRIISLLGHAGTAPFAWNGSAKTLGEQVKSSIEVTMQSDSNADEEQIESLVTYIESLPPPPSLAVARGVADSADDHGKAPLDGNSLFLELGCGACHTAPTYTSDQLVDVGTVDELGEREFNPPSLIGVSQRRRLMHDGRYNSLSSMLTESGHQLKRVLAPEELRTLLTFLEQL